MNSSESERRRLLVDANSPVVQDFDVASIASSQQQQHKHKHEHSHSHRRCTKSSSYLFIGALTLLYSFAEIIFAMMLGSLTLLSDGFHNLSDVIALGIAYYAATMAERKISVDGTRDMLYTYGWKRTEVLGGLTNGVFLLSLSLYIVLESIPRLVNPEAIDQGLPFIGVASVGLGINTLGTIIFGLVGGGHHGHSHSHGHKDAKDKDKTKKKKKKKDLNLMGIFLHFLGDMLSSFFCIIDWIGYPF